MLIVSKSLFTKDVQCSPFARTHAWRVETVSALVSCSVNDVLLEIGPYRN